MMRSRGQCMGFTVRWMLLQYAASFHCLVEEWRGCEELEPKPKEKWVFVDREVESKNHRTQWCAATSRYRCLRCGRKQYEYEDARGGVRAQGGWEWNATPPKLKKWEKARMGEQDMVRRVGPMVRRLSSAESARVRVGAVWGRS